MELSYQINQVQTQSQKQILSPQMKESLELLQLSLPELQKRIDQEVLENPVLECEPTSISSNAKTDTGAAALSSGSTSNPQYQTSSSVARGSFYQFDGQESYDLLASTSEIPSFQGFLLRQLSEQKIAPEQSSICRYLIQSLDERGYLSTPITEITKHLTGTTLSLVKKALCIVQQLEPPGVAAANLQECLTLQWKRQPNPEPIVFKIISEHLKLVAENRMKELAQHLNISLSDAQFYCNMIRSLNPIPSNGFYTGTPERFAVPEAIILEDESGRLQIKSNHTVTVIPTLSPYYLNLLKTTADEKTKIYLRQKVTRASRLIQELSKREKTILRILKIIVQLQPLYFKKGPLYLKPMSMKQIADQLNLNESTISRAVQDKFILCAWGMVGLKSLFSNPIQTTQTELVTTAPIVKNAIEKLIQSENKFKPFSDQTIVWMLKQSGILIARRTVTKYRESLGILPASKRRRYPA